MDIIHSLGSIASIISVIPLAFIIRAAIKKVKISPFNLYMLAMVLIQVISVGYSLWDKNVIGITLGGIIFMFTILFWLVLHLNEKQMKLIQIIEKQHQITGKNSEMIIREADFSTEINWGFLRQFEALIEVAYLTTEQIDRIAKTLMLIIQDSNTGREIKVDVNTKSLENELKKMKNILKKIEKQKPTK